jgi:hypothetical protein
MKLIYSKYPATCGGCAVKISAGQPLYWQKGKKALCPTCYGSGKTPESSTVSAATPTSSKVGSYYPDFTIDWFELRPLIKDAVTPGNRLSGWKNAANRNRFRKDLSPAYSSFAGFNRGDLELWIKDGYKTSAIAGLSAPTPMREKRRSIFVEDGDEIVLERAWQGEDTFMTRSVNRDVIPGVRLNIELDASAGSSGMLFHYQRWIAQTIYSLETSGVDCEVNIYTLSRGLFTGQSGTCRQMVRVKKSGEISDFAGFSTMFSPAAFRGIMFSTFALHADRQNLSLRGYGSGVTTEWGVKYSSELKEINVACNWMASEFPEGMMNSALKVAIDDLKNDLT